MKSDETRTLILKSAIELFVDKGYHGTSTNDIRMKAGNLSRGGLYYHFPKKEDILRALPEYLSKSDEELNKLLEEKASNSLEKIRNILIYKCQHIKFDSNEILYKKLMKDYTFKEINQQYIEEQIIPLYTKLLIAGNQDGSLHVKYPEYFSPILVAILNDSLNANEKNMNIDKITKRVAFIRDFLTTNGMPVFNDELSMAFTKLMTIYSGI